MLDFKNVYYNIYGYLFVVKVKFWKDVFLWEFVIYKYILKRVDYSIGFW